MKKADKNKPIIFYDGTCNLCNGLVQYINKRDKKGILRYETLQSVFGNKILEEHNLLVDNIDTIVLQEGDKIYIKSTAVFRIIHHLGGFLRLILVFKLLPVRLNDFLYDLVALKRYQWFGKRDHCPVIKNASTIV